MAIEPGLDYGSATPYVSPWADYLPSLYLSFSINKMRITIEGFLFRSKELIPATHLAHSKCLVDVSYL